VVEVLIAQTEPPRLTDLGGHDRRATTTNRSRDTNLLEVPKLRESHLRHKTVFSID